MSRQGRHTQHLDTYLIEVPIMESFPTEDGYGTRAVAVGVKTCKVQILVDPDAARALAFKAATNSSRKSVIGPLKAIVLEPRK